MARTLLDGSKMNMADWANARKRAIATYDHKCAICGRDLDKTAEPYTPTAIEVDHRIPIARGGRPYDLDNLQLTCMACNRKKGMKLRSDYDPIKDVENILPLSTKW